MADEKMLRGLRIEMEAEGDSSMDAHIRIRPCPLWLARKYQLGILDLQKRLIEEQKG